MRRARIKAEEERKAAEAAAVAEATQPRPGAVPSRYVEFANKDETQVPPWRTSELFQTQRVLAKVSGIRKWGDLTPTGPSARWSEVSRRAASQAVASGEQQAEKRARPSFHPEMPAMPPPAATKAKAPTLPEEEIYPGLFNVLPDLRNAAAPTPTTGGNLAHSARS